MILGALIAGCSMATPSPSGVQDSSLPTVNSIRTVSSTKAIGLEWDDSKNLDVKGYYIYRSKLNEPMKNIAKITDRYSTHYADEGLEPGTAYRYMMRTYGDSGISREGVIVTATTSKAIDSVSFAQALYGLPERVKLIWRPHSNLKVGSYIIERRKGDTGSWSTRAEVKGRLNAEYIDTGVTSNTTYQYRIRVKTLDGEISEPSQILTSKTKPLPESVINLRATVDQPKKIILTWDSPMNENFSHYQIYSSRAEFLPALPLAQTNTNSYEDLINTNGARRYYKVTFVDKDGLESEAQSSPVIGQTLDSDPAPVMAEPIINNNTIVLNWSTGAEVEKFTLVRSGGGSDRTIDNIARSPFVDSDVKKGVKYTYQVHSVDKYGINSSKSNRVSVQF